MTQKERLLQNALHDGGLAPNLHQIIGQAQPCDITERLDCRNGGRCLKWAIRSNAAGARRSIGARQAKFAFACECPVPFFGILCQQKPVMTVDSFGL